MLTSLLGDGMQHSRGTPNMSLFSESPGCEEALLPLRKLFNLDDSPQLLDS